MSAKDARHERSGLGGKQASWSRTGTHPSTLDPMTKKVVLSFFSVRNASKLGVASEGPSRETGAGAERAEEQRGQPLIRQVEDRPT